MSVDEYENIKNTGSIHALPYSNSNLSHQAAPLSHELASHKKLFGFKSSMPNVSHHKSSSNNKSSSHHDSGNELNDSNDYSDDAYQYLGHQPLSSRNLHSDMADLSWNMESQCKVRFSYHDEAYKKPPPSHHHDYDHRSGKMTGRGDRDSDQSDSGSKDRKKRDKKTASHRAKPNHESMSPEEYRKMCHHFKKKFDTMHPHFGYFRSHYKYTQPETEETVNEDKLHQQQQSKTRHSNNDRRSNLGFNHQPNASRLVQSIKKPRKLTFGEIKTLRVDERFVNDAHEFIFYPPNLAFAPKINTSNNGLPGGHPNPSNKD